MKYPIPSGLLAEYLQTLDPMIMFITLSSLSSQWQKFVVCTVHSRLKNGIACLNPTKGMGIRLHFFCLSIVLGRVRPCGGQIALFRIAARHKAETVKTEDYHHHRNHHHWYFRTRCSVLWYRAEPHLTPTPDSRINRFTLALCGRGCENQGNPRPIPASSITEGWECLGLETSVIYLEQG